MSPSLERPVGIPCLSEFRPHDVATHGFVAPSTSFPRPRGVPSSGSPSSSEDALELPPSGSGPRWDRAQDRFLITRIMNFPSWGSSAPSAAWACGSAHPGFASPGTFRPRGFSPPRRLTPRTLCGPQGTAATPGVRWSPADPSEHRPNGAAEASRTVERVEWHLVRPVLQL
jgi:hypothetical protein